MTVKNFTKLDGTTTNKLQLNAATATGVVLKDVSGELDIRNAADSAFGNVAVAKVKLEGGTYITSLLPSPSQTVDWVLTLPTTAGSPNQVLQTDGSGVTTWVDTSSGATDITDTTSFAFGSAATISAFTLPANAVILQMTIVVDTAFDGTPSCSVGISGNASKYMGSGDVNLNVAAGWNVQPNLPADGSSEAIEIAYSAGSATVGAARLLVNYSIPA